MSTGRVGTFYLGKHKPHDWTALFDEFDRRIEQAKQINLEEGIEIPMDVHSPFWYKFYKDYDLGEGWIVTANPDFRACVGQGPAVLSQIPLAQEITQIFSKRGTFTRTFIYRMDQTLIRHVDYKHKCTGINWFIDTAEVFTKLENPAGEIEGYQQIKDDIWLINNTLPHWVDFNQRRRWLHIRIFEEYEVVKRVLLDSGLFHNGDKRGTHVQ